MLSFIRNFKEVSKVVVLFYISTTMYENYSCSASLSTLSVVSLFNVSHSYGYEIALCDFNMHFFDI
jgi:hypothetical protein